MKKTIPGLIHECPYFGYTGFNDLNINEVLSPIIPHVVPTGTYRANFIFTKLNHPNITYAAIEITAQGDAIDFMKSMKMG